MAVEDESQSHVSNYGSTSDNGDAPASENHIQMLTTVSASNGDTSVGNNDTTSSKSLNTEIRKTTDNSASERAILQDQSLPRLSDNARGISVAFDGHLQSDEEDEDPNSFPSAHSAPSTEQHDRGSPYQKLGEEGLCQMHRFRLYETASRFYLVGADVGERRFRVLKIDRTAMSGDLNVAEDDIVYTKTEIMELLETVGDGNKSSGGMKLRCTIWGLLGFIRFTAAYYMLLITKRRQVALLGGHYIYQVDGTELVSLTTPTSRFKLDRDAEEARFVGILNNVDLSRSFYFSSSYDITQALQKNMIRERRILQRGKPDTPVRHQNSMFIWNHHLLEPASTALKNLYDWCLPIVHGFVNQSSKAVLQDSGNELLLIEPIALRVFGRTVYITIIARRSRFFAGARFLKRGANDLGYVANDVETEQIVSEMRTTSFHAPGPELFANTKYTSYVQHRGSIPLYWTQDNTGVSPKPDIELNLKDPFYSAAALHFDDLFARYGAPIYILNLVKSRERTARESILLEEYGNAITYLNQFLPTDKKILYKAWDMSRASKRGISRDQDVIGTLESIAEDVLTKTGFFHNGANDCGLLSLQSGVARTNCIDCLDRTNAAQFVIGKRALGHQLHALGVLDKTLIDYDTDAVNLFTHMYHDHGDTIAIQYGGSQLVNTMETYRKTNQWHSHSRDMVASFKRYYNNSFLDRQRQEAYNLFLGNYIYVQGQPMLWDLATDYYLHHADPRAWSKKQRKSYINWFTPQNLSVVEIPRETQPQGYLAGKSLSYFDEYWAEYYRPFVYSTFQKMFAIKLSNTWESMPFKHNKRGEPDLSPFRMRDGTEHASPEKDRQEKSGSLADHEMNANDDHAVETYRNKVHIKRGALPGWLHSPHNEGSSSQRSIMDERLPELEIPTPLPTNPLKEKKTPKEKAAASQWTLHQFVTNSLNPSVADAEAYDYQRYISYPLNIPLVVSTETPSNPNLDFVSYINKLSLRSPEALHPTEDDFADYSEFLDIGEEPLTVTEADTAKKRYKAYRQWVKGKSLFKQRADP